MKAPRVMQHEQSLLDDLRYAVHGLGAPFACGGTLVPDQPLTLCFQDKIQIPVQRAPRVFSDSRKTCMLLKIGDLSIPAFVNITPIKSTTYAF